MSTPLEAEVAATIARLIAIALRDTGQSQKVANFLLAWHNASENGGWDPTELWGVDQQIAGDMLKVLHLVRLTHRYPADLGFEKEIKQVWDLWRGSTR